MNLGTRESYPLARAREERAQTRWSFFFFFFVVVVSRLCVILFFFRMSFLSGGQKSSHADPSSVFIRVCVYT